MINRWGGLITLGLICAYYPYIGKAQSIVYSTVLSSEVALNQATDKYCNKSFFPLQIRGTFEQKDAELNILRSLKTYHDIVQDFVAAEENAPTIPNQNFVDLLSGTSEYETAKIIANKYAGKGLPTKIDEQIDFILYAQIEKNPTADFNQVLKKISDQTNGIHPHRKYLSLVNYIQSTEKTLLCLANTYMFRPGFNLRQLTIKAGDFTTFHLGNSPSPTLTSLLSLNGNYTSFVNSTSDYIIKFSTGVLINIENQSFLNSLGAAERSQNRNTLYVAFQEKYRRENFVGQAEQLPSTVLSDLERSIPKAEQTYDDLTTLKYLKRNYLEQLLLHQYRFKLVMPEIDSLIIKIPEQGCYRPLTTRELDLGIYTYKSEEPEHQGPLLSLESLTGELSRTLRNTRQNTDQLALIQSSYNQEFLSRSVEVSLLLKAKKMLNIQWWLYAPSPCMDQKEGLANGSVHEYCEELRRRNFAIQDRLSDNISKIDLKISEILNINPEIIVEVDDSSGPMAHIIRGDFGAWLLKTTTSENMKTIEFPEEFSKQAKEISSQFITTININDYLHLIQSAIIKSLQHNLNHMSQVCARNTIDEMMSLTQSPGVFWGRASPLLEQFIVSSDPETTTQTKDMYMRRINSSYDNLFSSFQKKQTRKELAFAALSLGGGALSVASFFVLPWVGVPAFAALVASYSFSAGALLVDTHYYFNYIVPKYQFANSQYHSFTLDSDRSPSAKANEPSDDSISSYVKLLSEQPLPLGSYERYQDAYQQYKWEKVFYYGGVAMELAGPLFHITKSAVRTLKIGTRVISSSSDIRRMFSLLSRLLLRPNWNSQLVKYAVSKNIGINSLADFWKPGNAEVAAAIIYAYLLDQYGFSNVVKLRMLEHGASPQSSQSALFDSTDWEKIKLLSNQSDTKNEEILHDFIGPYSSAAGNNYQDSSDYSVFDYLVLTKATYE